MQGSHGLLITTDDERQFLVSVDTISAVEVSRNSRIELMWIKLYLLCGVELTVTGEEAKRVLNAVRSRMGLL